MRWPTARVSVSISLRARIDDARRLPARSSESPRQQGRDRPDRAEGNDPAQDRARLGRAPRPSPDRDPPVVAGALSRRLRSAHPALFPRNRRRRRRPEARARSCEMKGSRCPADSEVAVRFTSPHRGEVGRRPGEGVFRFRSPDERDGLVFFTSPHRGEVGRRPGEGVFRLASLGTISILILAATLTLCSSPAQPSPPMIPHSQPHPLPMPRSTGRSNTSDRPSGPTGPGTRAGSVPRPRSRRWP